MQKSIFFLFLLLLSFWNLKSQSILTLEEAKKITLANNYGIAVAKTDLEIAENLTDKKANGYLPTVSATGGLRGSLGGSEQTFNSGAEASTSNAFTLASNLSVNADYALLDKRRGLTLKQLKKSAHLSDLQLRLAIEENLFQVYNAYFLVAQLTENLEALRQVKNVSEEQLRRAESLEYYGQGSKLNLLNAKVDIQRDSVNLLKEKGILENAKRDLNVLMGIPPSTDFEVEIRPVRDETLSEKTLLRKAKNNNLTLRISRQILSVEQINLDLVAAEKQPTISVGTSYDLNSTNNPDEAFIVNSNSRGLAANMKINWTVFDGSRKIRQQNTLLKLSNEKRQINQLELELERNLRNAFSDYENALFILKVEKNAVKINQENFTQTEAQYKFGRLTSIEFRQAQVNLLNAQTSLNNAKFSVKKRRMELLKLTGELEERWSD